MSREGQTGRARFQFRLRSLLLLTFAAAILLKLVVGWCLPYVREAREAARNLPCDNTLSVHTGMHPPEVQLDENLQVIRVIPVCALCTTVATPHCRIVATGTDVAWDSLPPATVARIEEALNKIREEEPYRRFRNQERIRIPPQH